MATENTSPNAPSPLKTPLPLTLCPWVRLPSNHRASSLWKYLSISLLVLSMLLLLLLVYFIISFVLSRQSNSIITNLQNRPLHSHYPPTTRIALDTTQAIKLHRGEGWRGDTHIPTFSADVTMTFDVPYGAILGVYGSSVQPPTHAKFQFFHQIDARRDKSAKMSKREANFISLPFSSSTSLSSFLSSSSSSSSTKNTKTYTIRQTVRKGRVQLFLYNDLTSIDHQLNLTLSLNESCQPSCVRGMCKGRVCLCDKGYHGKRCENKKCDNRCQGDCREGRCVCAAGWYGHFCSIEGCPMSCLEHGKCTMVPEFITPSSPILSPNYPSFYSLPYLGYFSSSSLTSSIPSSSNSSLSSLLSPPLSSPSWKCTCSESWSGRACSIALETTCDDKTDNDHDTLTDCNDPDCCSNPSCKSTDSCHIPTSITNVLLRKNYNTVTASFFSKVKFLIEETSVQLGATATSFNQSQVSVIRGSVLDGGGIPLVKVKVESHLQPFQGHTFTNMQGIFDLLVNGGGSTTLRFSRASYKEIHQTVLVPWNKIIVVDTVVMHIKGTQGEKDYSDCDVSHDVYNLQPQVHTWWSYQRGSAFDYALVNKMILQESLQLPETSIYLKHTSSKSEGYTSLLFIRLTNQSVPASLAYIKLLIHVEGTMHEVLLEASEELVYKFSWKRKNAYNQKVYGVVQAVVSVGYQYYNCSRIFWEKRSVYLHGHDVVTTELGGFEVNSRHTYGFVQGILHKGEGKNEYLKEKPGTLVTLMGDGGARRVNCEDISGGKRIRSRRSKKKDNRKRNKSLRKKYSLNHENVFNYKYSNNGYYSDQTKESQTAGCDGSVKDARLIAPVALASGKDGSIYIGDYNYIRMVSPNWDRITNILKLNIQATVEKYFMTVSPLDGRLYISIPHLRQIIKATSMGSHGNMADNYEKVVGSGEQCYYDGDGCGDGGPPILARLFFPNSIAINKDGVMFISDGNMIRKVQQNIITTIIGHHHRHLQHFNPFPCFSSVPQNKMMLTWPRAIAINPLDESLYILADNLIYKLIHKQVILIAGKLPHCYDTAPSLSSPFTFPTSSYSTTSSSPTSRTLKNVQDISFSPDGQLFIVESDGLKKNMVHKLKLDGTLEKYIGSDGVDYGGYKEDDEKDNEEINYDDNDENDESDESEDSNEGFNNLKNRNISALTVSQNGSLLLADVSSKKIYAMLPNTPGHNRTGHYHITDPFSHQIYTLNRFGHHISSTNFLTNHHVIEFSYNLNSFFGTLTTIMDSQGDFIKIKKGPKSFDLSLSNGLKIRLQIVHNNLLQSFNQLTNQSFHQSTKHHSNNQLLVNHHSTHYSYADKGLISSIRGMQNNQITMDTNLAYDITGIMHSLANQKKEAINIDQLDLNTYAIRTNDRLLVTKMDQDSMVVLLGNFQVKIIHSSLSTSVNIPSIHLTSSISSNQLYIDSYDKYKSYNTNNNENKEKDLVISKKIEFKSGQVNLRYNLRWVFYKDQKSTSGENKEDLNTYTGRKLMINARMVMAVEYDRLKQSDTLFIVEKNNKNPNNKSENINNVKTITPLISVDYQKNGLIKRIYQINENSLNNTNLFPPIEFTYYSSHKIKTLIIDKNQDNDKRKYEYSYNGVHLAAVKMNGDALVQYDYDKEIETPIRIQFPQRNVTYKIDYSPDALLTSISKLGQSHGNIGQILEKEGQGHDFKVKCLATVCRLVYGSPRFQPHMRMKIDYDIKGHVTRVQYPSGVVGWEVVARAKDGLFMIKSLTSSVLKTQSTRRYHVDKESLRLKEATLIIENNKNNDEDNRNSKINAKNKNSPNNKNVKYNESFVHYYSSVLKFDSRSFLCQWHISQISLHLNANKINKNNNTEYNNTNNNIAIVARYNYSYNNNLKVTSIQSHIDTTPHYVHTQNYDYNVNNGLLIRSGDFMFKWSNQSMKRIISRGNFRIITEWDQYRMVRTDRIVVKMVNNKKNNNNNDKNNGNNNKYNSEEEYNQHSNNFENNNMNKYKLVYKSMVVWSLDKKPTKWNRFVLNKLKESYNYNYDGSANRLVSVESGSGKSLWKFNYDVNTHVISEVNKDGGPFEKVDIGKLNKDGFVEEVKKKGISYKLAYDSAGMLGSVVQYIPDTSNFRETSLKVKFVYDALKRLTAQLYFDHLNDNSPYSSQIPSYHLHFFYNHPSSIYTLSHSFDTRTDKHNLYHYDNDNVLIGVSIGDNTYYVATDFFGSPVLLVHEDNYTRVFNVNYSPTGKIIDEDPNSPNLPIGFHGGLKDHVTDMTYFPEKGWFDPETNRYVTYDPSTYFHPDSFPATLTSQEQKLNTKFVDLVSNLVFLNPLLPDIGFWKEIDLKTSLNYGIEKTLSFLKYDLDYLMPKISHLGFLVSHPSSSPTSSPSSPASSPFLLMQDYYSDLLTPIQCSYQLQFIHQLYKLSSPTPSPFLPPQRHFKDPCHSTVTSSSMSWLFNHVHNVNLLPKDVEYIVDSLGMLQFRLLHHHSNQHHKSKLHKHQHLQHQQQNEEPQQQVNSLAHLFINIFNSSFIQQNKEEKSYFSIFEDFKDIEHEEDDFVIYFIKKSTRQKMEDETRILSLEETQLPVFEDYYVTMKNSEVIFKSDDVTLVLTYVILDL